MCVCGGGGGGRGGGVAVGRGGSGELFDFLFCVAAHKDPSEKVFFL